MANFKKNSNQVKLSDVVTIALKNWYWVLLSLIICIGMALLYIWRTVPTYTRDTAVLIRDDAQGSMGPSSVDLESLGIVESNTILEDEMAALQSPDLMQQVVEKLGLQVLYTSPGTFHSNVLYGSSLPVKVSFPDMAPEESASITFTVDPKGKISVTTLKVNDQLYTVNPKTPVTFGGSINTPSGRIVIEKTPFFQAGKELTETAVRLPLRSATEMFESKISVTQQNKESNVVLIACSDQSIQRADEVLTTLVDCYNQDWVKAKAQIVATTNNFINDRLAAVESELGSVDSNISSFKSSNLVPDVGQASSIYMQQSSQVSNQIMDYSNQLQMARYLRNYLSNEGKNQVLPVNTGIASASIEGLISDYNTLMLQRNSLLANTSETNPIVIDIDSRLAALRRSIMSSIDNQIVSISTTLQGLERNEQSATARVAANPRQAKYLLSAERKQKVQESLYLFLLQKREENELSQPFTSINTRVIRRPSGSDFPTSPKRIQILAIAFVLGLAIPFGLIYGSESANTRVRGRRDLKHLSLPIIGEIPKFRHGSKPKLSYFYNDSKRREKTPPEEDLVVKEGSRNMVNEAFRVLRTNVNFITADSTPCVIMLTSFNPGSGKTFITANLGVSLALKGRRVLLVDADLRRATLSRFVSNPHKGLADYLAGTCRDADTVIIRDALAPGLDVLPVGAIPPNPTELLETSRFTNLIEYLRTEYEFIFLDCPPEGMMADAQIISTVADRTFFVIRVGLFERSMLEEVERLYMEKKYPSMSVILNDAVTGARYGYAYSYGYGYNRSSHVYGGNYGKYYAEE